MLEHIYGLTPEEAQVQIAIVTGVATVLVSVIGVIGARRFTRPRVPSRDPDEDHNRNQSVLATYSGDQNEFMRLVMKDSQDVHEKLDSFDAIILQMKKERTQFIGAVGRYITKLANAWGSGGKMPYPDDIDLALLEETLPVDWRRRT